MSAYERFNLSLRLVFLAFFFLQIHASQTKRWNVLNQFRLCTDVFMYVVHQHTFFVWVFCSPVFILSLLRHTSFNFAFASDFAGVCAFYASFPILWLVPNYFIQFKSTNILVDFFSKRYQKCIGFTANITRLAHGEML